ncbi:hypothetical protein [Streptosporangium sp. G12]
MDRWFSGRVVLLGDAAYCAAPASGRGASQALIGAYILAGELAAGGDHAQAFASTSGKCAASSTSTSTWGAKAPTSSSSARLRRRDSTARRRLARTWCDSRTTLPASPRSGRHPAGLPADLAPPLVRRCQGGDGPMPGPSAWGNVRMIMTTRR